MPEICSAIDNGLEMSGTITEHLHMSKSRTRVNVSAISELVVSVLLGMTNIDRCIKSIHPAKRKIVLCYSPPLPILILDWYWREADTEKPDSCQQVIEGWPLWFRPTRYDRKYIMISRRVVLEETCETPF